MYPIIFNLGPVTIYTYGLMIFLGAICAYFYCIKSAPLYGISKEFVSDLFFWTILCGFLGARLIYILIDLPDFVRNPWAYIFTTAGFVFFGGLLFGVLTLFVYSRMKNQNILTVSELVVPALPLAHAFGRIGCFFYGCCFGRISDGPICLFFPPDSPAGYHGHSVIPTQLISALGLIIIFCILLYIRKKNIFSGVLTVSYLIMYGIMRFSVEFLRGDERGTLVGLSTSQWFSIAVVISGVILFRKLSKNIT